MPCTPLAVPVFVAAITPAPDTLPVSEGGARFRRKLVASRPSRLSALSLDSFTVELVTNGGRPAPTVRPSAGEFAAGLVLVSCRALAPATGAANVLAVVAVFAWPRMKLPPVIA